MGYFSCYNDELGVLRQVYFYECVCSKLEADTILEMMSTNSEMAYIEDFSKWLFHGSGDDHQVEHLKKWLTDIGHQDYFNEMFDEKYSNSDD
jgi:hypothetical protein